MRENRRGPCEHSCADYEEYWICDKCNTVVDKTELAALRTRLLLAERVVEAAKKIMDDAVATTFDDLPAAGISVDKKVLGEFTAALRATRGRGRG